MNMLLLTTKYYSYSHMLTMRKQGVIVPPSFKQPKVAGALPSTLSCHFGRYTGIFQVTYAVVTHKYISSVMISSVKLKLIIYKIFSWKTFV